MWNTLYIYPHGGYGSVVTTRTPLPGHLAFRQLDNGAVIACMNALHSRPQHSQTVAKTSGGVTVMASTDGYTVPSQNGEAATPSGGGAQALSGRSSEPTFSAALTVWKGKQLTEHALHAFIPMSLSDSSACTNRRHQPGRPAEDTRRARSRDY